MTRRLGRARFVAAALCAAVLGAGGVAHAASSQAEIGITAESLSAGYAPWHEVAFALRHEWAPRTQIELTLRETERFDRRDEEIGIGLAAPLPGGFGATLAASASPSHAILPRSSLAAGVNRVLGDGWVLGAGLRSTHYDGDRANAVSATLERYFASGGGGEWRAAATVVTTRLVGVATSSALRLQLDRYFGDRARLGLLVAGGREIDNLGQGALLISNVSSVSLSGRWPIAPAWSLLGEVGQHRLGSRYTRSAGRLGVQLDF